MSEGGFSRATWAGLGLLGAAVVVTLFFSSQIRSRAEQIEDALAAAPRASIAHFPAASHGRIEGRVRLPPSAPVAPLSGQRCAYYELELEDAAGARRRVSRRIDFEVADATGQALVRVQNALVAIDESHCRSGILADLPFSRRAALTVEEDLAYLDGLDPAAVRIRECIVPADAHVAVAGGIGPSPLTTGRLVLGAHGPIYIGVPARPAE